MKFTVTVETDSNSFHGEFEIENQDIARAKLAQTIAEIQKRFGAAGEKAAVKRATATAPTNATPATAPAVTNVGPDVRRGTDHAK
jgi:hypothetical protein